MRKKLKILFLAVISLTFLILACACNNPSKTASKSFLIKSVHTHNYEWTLKSKADCENAEKWEGICECGDVTTKFEGTKLGHTESVIWETTVYPTCSSTGTKVNICAVCGEIAKTLVIDKIPHLETYEEVVYEPTCSTQGTTNHYCKSCKEYVKTTYPKATGHQLDNNFYCSACKKTIKESNGMEYELVVYNNGASYGYMLTGLGSLSYTEEIYIPEYYDDGFYGKFPVVAIGEEVFKCQAIENATDLKNALVKIKSVHIPETILEIGQSAFYSCIFLEEVVFEGNSQLISIGQLAFAGCSGLIKFEIPSSVIQIGGLAFYDCSKLVEIYNKSIIDFSAENRAILGLTEITKNIYTPRSGSSKLVEYGDYTFYEDQSNSYLIRYNGSETSVTMPNIEKDYALFDGAFYAEMDITSIEIPSYVNDIGEACFMMCTSLTSIEIPNTVNSVGAGAFTFCEDLTDVKLNCKNPEIGSFMFAFCTSLTNYTLPSGVTEIGDYAFSGAGITQIDLSNITTINSYAFLGTPLKSVDLSFVQTIGEYAFSESLISSVVLSKNLTQIPKSCFENCKNLELIEIPSGVKTICQNAFSGSGVTEISIPSTVESVDAGAFRNCVQLKKLIATESTSFNNAAFSSTNYIEYAEIPMSLVANIQKYTLKYLKILNGESLDANAIYNAKNLTTLIFPENLRTIGYGAVSNCSNLRRITIPKGVEKIDDDAFSGCVNLYEVVNLSSLNIEIGSTANGSVGYYAKKIYMTETDESIYLTYGDHLFYRGEDNQLYYGYYIGTDSNVIVPEVEEGYILPYRAFNSLNDICSITFSKGLTKMCQYSIVGCYNLLRIELPETLVEIEANAFEPVNFKGLYEICNNSNIVIESNDDKANLGYKAKYIYSSKTGESKMFNNGGYWFYDDGDVCSLIAFVGGEKEIILPKIGKNYEVGEEVFSAEKITSVEICNEVTKINKRAFYNCSNLVSVTFEKNSQIHTLDENAFYYCQSLTSITIPSSVNCIKNGVFSSCNSLNEIVFENPTGWKRALGNNWETGTIYEVDFSNYTSCKNALVLNGAIEYRRFD